MDIYSIALSGLQTAQAQLNVGAQNVANLDTPGYQSRQADIVELSGGGVAVAGVSVNPSPGPAQPDGAQGSNVDLANEAVNLTRARLLYSANAALVRIGNRITGSLLDITDDHRHKS